MIEHTADMRVWDTVQYGKATTRDLYAKERALLRFPEALKTCFDVTCWPARTTDEGIVYVYGTAVHLGPNYRGGQTVYVAVRLNGEVLVTNAAGNVIRMTDIPPENLHEFKMDQPPPTSRSYLDYRCKNPMDAGCPSGNTSSRRFPGGLIFGSSEITGQTIPIGK